MAFGAALRAAFNGAVQCRFSEIFGLGDKRLPMSSQHCVDPRADDAQLLKAPDARAVRGERGVICCGHPPCANNTPSRRCSGRRRTKIQSRARRGRPRPLRCDNIFANKHAQIAPTPDCVNKVADWQNDFLPGQPCR